VSQGVLAAVRGERNRNAPIADRGGDASPHAPRTAAAAACKCLIRQSPISLPLPTSTLTQRVLGLPCPLCATTCSHRPLQAQAATIVRERGGGRLAGDAPRSCTAPTRLSTNASVFSPPKGARGGAREHRARARPVLLAGRIMRCRRHPSPRRPPRPRRPPPRGSAPRAWT